MSSTITKLFNIRSNANPEIKSTLTRLFTYFQSYCIPFPSISPTIYKYKENHNLYVLSNEVRKIKASILKYIINYDLKVVGIICEINNQKGYLPCFPSNVIDEDMQTEFLDEIDLWNSYTETIQFLKMIKNIYDIIDKRKLDSVSEPIEKAHGLPNECYLNGSYTEIERKKIFEDKWVVVGTASSVPKSGDAKPFDLLGIPLIMIRDKDKYKEYTKKGRIQKILKETIKKISDNQYNSKFKYLGYNTDIPYHRQFGIRDL